LGPTANAAVDGHLFADDFESGSFDQWPDGVNETRHHIVTDPAGAQSGSRYLVVTFPPGQDGGWLSAFLPPGHDALRVSYYLRFPNGWNGAPKLVAFYGSRTDDQWSAFGKAGLCPSGSDFFAAMLATEPPGDPGPTRFYTYYPGMAREPDGRTCWGRYGDGTERYISLTPFERGRWHRIDFEVRLNARGQRNARQDFWIDGEHRAAWSGFSFGDPSILRLNAIQLNFNMADNSRRQQLHVDNLVVTRAE
jgi:hypothetical protein